MYLIYTLMLKKQIIFPLTEAIENHIFNVSCLPPSTFFIPIGLLYYCRFFVFDALTAYMPFVAEILSSFCTCCDRRTRHAKVARAEIAQMQCPQLQLCYRRVFTAMEPYIECVSVSEAMLACSGVGLCACCTKEFSILSFSCLLFDPLYNSG